jgi:hypothetical protein
MTMRAWITTVAALTLSSLAWSVEPAPKSQAPTAAKPKAVAAKSSKAAPLVTSPVLPSPVADAKVQEAVAGEVHTGHMVCELGNSVTITQDPQQPTRFIVQMKKATYYMTPVETSTGAVRLEDAQAGAMWLQLPHKSMLMNSKLGQRMADECQNDHQMAVAQTMKLNPPPSLLESPALAKK